RWVLGRRPKIGAESRPLDHDPGADADDDGEHDDPRAIRGQEHEAEVVAAGELARDRVRQARRPELVPEAPLDDQRDAEREEQPDEDLTAQRLDWNAEDRAYFFTSGHSPWSSGRNACSAGIVARTL